MPKKKVPWNEVEGRLHMALQEFPPSSMEEVARRMGYYQQKLTHHFPELCSQIVARYKEHLKSKHPDPRQIRKVFRMALKEQPPPSLQSVFRRLGCKDTGYYYYDNYPDLCSAVAQRYKSYRNKPFNAETDGERLSATLLENPPPSLSEMAGRLGHKNEFLRRKFPELCKAIVVRYLYFQTDYHKEKAKVLRQEIREAIQQIADSGLYVSEARVKAYIRQHLPGPGRDSLFKQALREVKSEMGIIK